MRKLIALLIATLAFVVAIPVSAQRDRDDRRQYENRDRRVSAEGRIRSFSRERDGYRIYLDRGNYSFWVPRSLLGRHELRTGLNVRFDGVQRGGSVWVDDIAWLGERDFGSDYLTGHVQRVDYRDERLVLRDDRGRTIEVNAAAVDAGPHRADLRNVHRGDRITLRGKWERGYFRAFRIESIGR